MSDPTHLPTSSAASGPDAGDRPGPLVSVAWLAAHLDDPDLRLVHTSSQPERYPAGHIRGAVFADLYTELNEKGHDPASPDVESHYLVPSREAVEASLERWGVGPGDRVVFCDDWARNRQAVRGLWLLRLHGWPAERVHVLDGGITAWMAAGLPLSTEVPAVPAAAPVQLSGGAAASLATVEQVKAWSAETVSGGPIRILDVRKPAEFVGDDRQSRRAGRVPGAVNVDWERFVHEDNTFRSPAEIRAIVDDAVRAAGGEDASSLRATYCQGGVRAAAAWFALGVLGDVPIANYARSWEEWGNRADTPIEAGAVTDRGDIAIPGGDIAIPGGAPVLRRPTPVIIDCDPGHDDALALLLALARPELRVLGVTTVAGNVGLAATTRNALSVLTLAGRTDIPVASGADAPLVRPLRTAAQVHGTSGLEGAALPVPAFAPSPEAAVALMARLARDAREPVTLVPTGPLTNIALFLGAHPELRSRIAHICLMGGSMGEGNWTASAEFNIWVDPDAAARVFTSGIPITQVTIDVTHQALVTVAESDAWADLGNRTGRAFAELFRFFAGWHARRYGWDGSPIHDAVAVAHLVAPGLVTVEPYRVDVETVSELTLGRTVIDRERLSGREPNAQVSVAIDRERFLALIREALAGYP